MKSRVFIGSSVENLDLAYATQEGMEHDVESTVWSQSIFNLSRTALASLVDQHDENDFGIFVLAPDDVTVIRDSSKQTVRDNIIFELGLFVGRLGSERCFLIVPRGIDDLHLPTDLLGMTPATYEPDRQDKNLVAALGSACNRIRKAIQKLGPLDRPIATSVSESPREDSTLYNDPVDCIALIEDWMGKRTSKANQGIIGFQDVDRDLNLAPGSARLYIEKAAVRWRYSARSKGEKTIRFKADDDDDMPF